MLCAVQVRGGVVSAGEPKGHGVSDDENNAARSRRRTNQSRTSECNQ